MYKNKVRIKSELSSTKQEEYFYLFFLLTAPPKGRACAQLEPFQEHHSTVASGVSDDPPHCLLAGREECGKISDTHGDDDSYKSAAHTQKKDFFF